MEKLYEARRKMSLNHASLDAAATERKARIAKSKSLKRKQSSTDPDDTNVLTTEPEPAAQYLSGRNYDFETRGPKLGFEVAPNGDAETLEDRATALAGETKEKEQKEEKGDKPIDLFQLQPKKPNWDLKRDVARKMEILNARTDNAIARLVRERIEEQRKKESEKNNGASTETGGENVGIGGVDLVEGMHVREREEQEDLKRDSEQYDEFL